MQTLINVLAISSFVVSGAVVGSGVFIYLNKDTLVQQVIGGSTEALVEGFVESPTGLIPTPLQSPTEAPQALPVTPFNPF